MRPIPRSTSRSCRRSLTRFRPRRHLWDLAPRSGASVAARTTREQPVAKQAPAWSTTRGTHSVEISVVAWHRDSVVAWRRYLSGTCCSRLRLGPDLARCATTQALMSVHERAILFCRDSRAWWLCRPWWWAGVHRSAGYQRGRESAELAVAVVRCEVCVRSVHIPHTHEPQAAIPQSNVPQKPDCRYHVLHVSP